MNEKERLRKIWEDFCKDKPFKLNPDKKHVDQIIEGVLQNEKKDGLKLCPCRIHNGEFEEKAKLICPCNFFSHKTWYERGDCWCGLFVKKD